MFHEVVEDMIFSQTDVITDISTFLPVDEVTTISLEFIAQQNRPCRCRAMAGLFGDAGLAPHSIESSAIAQKRTDGVLARMRPHSLPLTWVQVLYMFSMVLGPERD